MLEFSKINEMAILHLFGEFSSLEVDWVSRVIESFKNSDHNKILVDLAYADHIHFQAVRHLAVLTQELGYVKGDLSKFKKFAGADQDLKDYSLVAGAMLNLLKAPLLPVVVFQESVPAEGDLEVSAEKISSSGMFFH